MIGPFAAGTTDPLVAKNLTKFFVYAFVISIAILWYLEANLTMAILHFFVIGVPQFYTRNDKPFLAKLKRWQQFL